VQATCKVNRNLTDDEIRGIAKTGRRDRYRLLGCGDLLDAAERRRRRSRTCGMWRGSTIVGLGSDFDGA